MAPTKKTAQDDSSSSSKAQAPSAKAMGKKPANSALNQVANSTPKDQSKVNGVDGGHDGQDSSKGLSWDKEDIEVLQRYRFQHRLALPAPYTNTFHRAVLENKGLGRHSPTAIAKHRAAQKQTSKQHLATAVRKHFNSMPADQTAVAAGMVYTINNQDREFKKRSTPINQKTAQT
ncbi:hypothetical protein BDZ85DRAFT_232546 [Elsinoe ampelina]|uniref:Histone deacetylase complex subunit SAP30 Sin3 binding domain-containing protein n=1 Tax=Elsinoe ampelina TaxID=302913 RepID=A0A6A6GKA5_9PEZI|nr:hypothetical protein BDZ85DRAFT_232546 [Elsinoe ampelina]